MFTAALVRQATAWSTLRWFYGGKTFAKRLGKSKIFPGFLLAKRKQHFEEKAVNRLIAESERGRDSPVVFAYGDGQFAFCFFSVFFLRKKLGGIPQPPQKTSDATGE